MVVEVAEVPLELKTGVVVVVVVVARRLKTWVVGETPR